MSREYRIVVRCHLDELRAIQAKAISLGKEPATYLREIGIAEDEVIDAEDEIQIQLHWLAGSIHSRLNEWTITYSEISKSLANSMQHMIAALKQLQLEALIDKVPPPELNKNFTRTMSKLNHADKSHQRQ